MRAERRQRYEDVPYGAERFAIALALYPEGHPLRHLTIGRHDDIQAATVDDVLAFYRTWYVPANATLVIAGDVARRRRRAGRSLLRQLPGVARARRARCRRRAVAGAAPRAR